MSDSSGTDKFTILDSGPVGDRVRLSSSRRRALLKGIGAPAVITLAASPAMACNCKLPSGFSVSGNLSRTGQQGTGCADGAKRPSVQRGLHSSGNYTALGGSTTIARTKLCKDHVSMTGASGTCAITSTQTYDTILGIDDTDIRSLFASCYIIASRYGGSTFPTTTTLVGMWNSVKGGGTYTPPAATVAWTREGVRKYLMYLTGQQTS
jgi:hypothetical protein